MPTSSLIVLDAVCKRYETAAGPVSVLRDIDLAVGTGESVAIMGPSGSGKSTLMNILGCLDVASSGRYLLDGQDVAGLDHDQRAHLRNRVIGFVFQGFNLLPRISLLDNVALPLLYASVPERERRRRAQESLQRVGLGGFEAYLPSRVSGGQQQRVAIARALVSGPRLILADEPTGNLDTQTSHEIMTLFMGLNAADGITLVLVTHEQDIADFTHRHVLLVDGRIAADHLLGEATAARVSP
ncbi:ABC transporter ATP-binding protein [Oleiagrimonas sp. C23AA]|uniref:ABC transporter ATP-binding protein n=1 Tax=Oleiagrimonas sp. C23AA TaxID=2719047 RepID=UPI00141DC566|nr:ABC transporter ATP-binding protein [Oleiagrimonas sp. C23AA]NII11081.1 ABC transporter ATP-binding protein [Oleiagrimonas sp. C23AA]